MAGARYSPGHIMLALALLCDLAAPGRAQGPARVPAHQIDQAAWLAGRWAGEGLGGIVEESWSPASGGQMIGHFALIREGKPVFYELMLLDVTDKGLRLRVKHFNPDFTAWEDKGGWHSFEPKSVAPGELGFDALSLRLEGEVLVATVTLRERGTGKVTDHALRLRRAPL